MPLSAGGTVRPKVHGHVKDFAADHPHELSLGMLLLVVQASQHTLRRRALVVLHELHRKAGFLHVPFIVGFDKVAPRVAVYGRLDLQQAFDAAGYHGDLTHRQNSPY